MSLPVPGLDWTLTVQREWREVIRPVVNVYGWILLVALATAVIASLAATWSVRDLVAGWQVLIQFSLAPAGHGALLEDSSRLRRLPLEFQDVMRRIAAMARRLDSETRAREQLLRELESRVQERTRELEAALEAVKSADRAKSAFLATVTHELRTPLTALRTDVETLGNPDANLSDEDRRQTAQAIDEQIDEVSHMITGIVDLARGARPVEQSEPLRLDDVAADVVARARSRRPTAVIELDTEEAPMVGDALRLELELPPSVLLLALGPDL
jgi:signal transduction histidine kinase